MSLYYPADLRRFHAKLADADYAQAHIVCLGDSITLGAYANNAGTTDDATWRTRGWVAQLRSLFALRYTDPGEGVIHAGDARFTRTGATLNSVNQSLGAFGYNLSLANDTQSVSLTATGRYFRVYAWWVQGTTGAFQYQVDGGGYATSTASSGSDTLYSFDIDAGSSGSHTIDIKGPASGIARILGVGAFVQITSGVAVHRVAKSGTVLKDAFALAAQAAGNNGGWTTAAPGPNRQADSCTDLFAPDGLAILAFSVNNLTAGWTTYADTPANIKTATQAVVDRLVAQGMSVLLLAGPQRDPTSYSIGYSQQDFDYKVREVADATSHCAWLDLNDAWASYASANALGLHQDTVHPTRAGHGDIARIVYDAVTRIAG